jgi:hypothetical protein
MAKGWWIGLGCAIVVIGLLVVGVVLSRSFLKTMAHNRVKYYLAVLQEGQEHGRKLDEKGCLAEAVERHRTQRSRPPSREGILLSGCLDTSKPSADFCVGVPGKGRFFEGRSWLAARCKDAGFSDSSCSYLFQQVIDYCSRPADRRKFNLKPAT